MKLFGSKPAESSQPRRRMPRYDDTPSPAAGQMFSYHAQRSQRPGNTGRRDPVELAAAQPVEAPTFRVRHRLLAGTLTVLAAAAAIGLSYVSPDPRVDLLEDKATAHFLQDGSVYRQSARQILGDSLTNRNKLTVDTAAVRLGLLRSYPEIKNVSVALPFFGTRPHVYIEPYRPSFILTTTTSNAFLLDETGRALAPASQITDIESIQVPTLQDRTGIEVKLGTRVLPSTTIAFATTVMAALEKAGLEASSLVLPGAAAQLDVRVSGDPYVVKYNLQADPLQQAGTYLAMRGKLAESGTKPTDYIDVRVLGRAYYK